MLRWGQDLTRGGRVCLEKALLGAVAGEGEEAFDVYQRYLAKFKLTHSHVNLEATEARGKKSSRRARQILFHQADPRRQPAFFDLSNYAVRIFFLALLSFSLSL